jgi:pentapeptide MXKDX repeat protein
MSIKQSARRAFHLALSLSAFAALSLTATAQSDSSMKKDPMKKDAMAKDGMMKDGMMKDGMMKDGMMKAVPHALNLDKSGVALHGYDPVAYFIAGTPEAGKSDFTSTHEGATYHFASAASRDAFAASPERYAPQFGGYCAMGVALGKKLDIDPAAWRIVDGKLYLNVNKQVQRDWQKDIPGNIQKAVANWPRIRSVAAREL